VVCGYFTWGGGGGGPAAPTPHLRLAKSKARVSVVPRPAFGNEATLVDHRPEGFTEPATAVAPYALEPENARRLWELSLAAVS
jgi:hypothetical protein